MAHKLRNNRFLHPLFVIRDWVMEKSGLFAWKAKIKQKIFFRRLLREDAEKKRRIDAELMHMPTGLVSGEYTSEDIVISLTSYGKRVTEALPYALYSLLTQTLLPKKIVVYLDKDNWSDNRLPVILRRIKEIGVDFRYCEDLRSYKKLIPALSDFPDNPIVTVDDDFYYNPMYLEQMMKAYTSSDKKTVLGQWGCIPEKKAGKFLPYSQWKDCKYGTEESPISFFGCGGCYYPPHVFDEEILKKDLFMKMCPTADDIWFWIMEERLGIKRKYINQKGYGWNIPVDRIYDYKVTADNCLTTENVVNGKNDIQLRTLLDYYQLD